MKKLLLCSAAVVGVAFSAAPAAAQIDVTIGGHTKNYIGWADQDDGGTTDTRSFDMLRESEIHLNAEGTADNGLTYGFHVEMEADAGDDANTIEESYLYLSSNLGRVNLGSEDGANYLLQVAAPSADANIDGIRQYIQPVNYVNAFTPAAGAAPAVVAANTAALAAVNSGVVLDYANDATAFDEKITYLSPVWSGFQFGGSYTPDVASNVLEDINSANGAFGFAGDDVEDNFGAGYEAAVRYEGQFNNIGFAVGGGYTHVDIEQDALVPTSLPVAGIDFDDVEQWNVGLDLNIGAFGLGAVYTETENVAGLKDADSDTWVVGGDYTTGPFQFGISYLNNDFEAGNVDVLDTDRYTGGVVYTAAPGLSFRGSISFVDHEASSSVDADATSVLGGIQLNF
jgi:predicted porin